MVVCGTAVIMAREYGLELHNTVAVGLGNAAEEGVVVVGQVIGVAIASGDQAGVDTSGVAVPNIPVMVIS